MGTIGDRMENWDKQIKNEKKRQVQLWQTRILSKNFKSKDTTFLFIYLLEANYFTIL